MQVVFKAELLTWLAHLRYLHHACAHTLLQAIVLSVFWRATCPVRPSLDELLNRFDVTMSESSHDGAQLTPLLRACHAARRRSGSTTELAMCFVALCRALDIPARLVVAMDPNSNSKSPTNRAQTATAKTAVPQGEKASSQTEETNDDAAQLMALGFSRDAAVAALIQSEQEGVENLVAYAADLLMECDNIGSEPVKSVAEAAGSSKLCPTCKSEGQHGAFCGNCGKRIRIGGACGSADDAIDEKEVDRTAAMTAWPEVYDAESGRWVAVDVAFRFLVRDPRVEWMHRGVPMLWLCSADDQLLQGCCIIRDVTARYSPSWWRVEQARGSRQVQRWWEELLSSGCQGGGAPSSGGNSKCQPRVAAGSQKQAAAAEAAAAADERDMHFLKARRLFDGIPTTKAGLKGHARYVLTTDLRVHEVLRPGSKCVGSVSGAAIFSRTSVVPALSVEQWQKRGRRVSNGEEPCKLGGNGTKLFGEWQTEEEEGLALIAGSDKAASSTTNKFRRVGKTRLRQPRKRASAKPEAMAEEPALPALKAPRATRARKKMTAKKTVKMAFSDEAFEPLFQRIQAWLENFCFLPYERSSEEEEASLARFVGKARSAYAAGRLSREQQSALGALPGWTWGDFKPKESSTKERGQKRPRNATASGKGADEKPDREQQGCAHDDAAILQRWSELTIARLRNELARQPDKLSRRACLRCWQRSYHPDKNPGRTQEVRPIFQWVQSCWDRGFRSADFSAAAAAEAAKAAASVPTTFAKDSSSGSSEVNQRNNKAIASRCGREAQALHLPVALAKTSEPKRRISGKRRCS